MSNEELLTQIGKLVTSQGKPRILSALTSRGVGASTAEKIVNGRYRANPPGLLAKALGEIVSEFKEAS